MRSALAYVLETIGGAILLFALSFVGITMGTVVAGGLALIGAGDITTGGTMVLLGATGLLLGSRLTIKKVEVK